MLNQSNNMGWNSIYCLNNLISTTGSPLSQISYHRTVSAVISITKIMQKLPGGRMKL